MNTEQLQAYNLYRQGKSVVITGSAGTGKSFVLSQILRHLKEKYAHVTNPEAQHFLANRAKSVGASRTAQQPLTPWALTATTGVSAQTIGGQTLHSWAGIGLGEESVEVLARKIRRRPPTLARWRSCRILVIDEISMMDATLFEKLHQLAIKLRNDQRFFGGIQLVLAGDFLQLPPVKSDHFCFESPVWEKYLTSKVIFLKEIFRQTEPEFQHMLGRIRLGHLTPADRTALLARQLKNNKMPPGLVKPTVLFPYRADVDQINEHKLETLIKKGAENRVYYPQYTIETNEHREIEDTVENNSIRPLGSLAQKLQQQALNFTSRQEIWDQAGGGKHNQSLKLAIKAQVMLTYNLDVPGGLVNGSRGVVLDFEASTGSPVVLFDNGRQEVIVRQKWTLPYQHYLIAAKQYPLVLAWAISVHKSQSATLTSVVADLSEVFSPGQTYVCLSRVRSLSGLHLIGIDFDRIRCHERARKFYCQPCEWQLDPNCQQDPLYERHIGGGQGYCWPCLWLVMDEAGCDMKYFDKYLWEKICSYLIA